MSNTNDTETRRTFIAAGARIMAGAVLTTGTLTASAAGQTSVSVQSNGLGLEYALTVRANIDPVISMGKTPTGERRVITISGGSFEGPRLKGAIMPGGEDWQITRADGVTELDARYWLRTDDGVIIRVQNHALVAPLPDTEGGKGGVYFRCSPRFEAPIGAHDWLNKAIFAGMASVDNAAQPKVVTLQFYKVT